MSGEERSLEHDGSVITNIQNALKGLSATDLARLGQSLVNDQHIDGKPINAHYGRLPS
jgi:hypothetical protein